MSLIDDLKTPKPWNWGTPANGVTMYNDTVKPLDDNIRMVASAVDNLPQPSEQVQANWNTSAASDPSFIQNKPTIPSKTSQLQNDAGFITSSGIPSVPTKTSDLQNDNGFITKDDIPAQVNPDWSVDDASDPRCILNKPESVDQVQADWNTSATSAASYIKNKPWVPENPIYSSFDRKVLMAFMGPDWRWPLVTPNIKFSSLSNDTAEESFNFTSAGQDISASSGHNFLNYFPPYSISFGAFRVEQIKTEKVSQQTTPASSRLRIHVIPKEDDEPEFELFDAQIPCPIPMNNDWSQPCYSGHDDGTGKYMAINYIIPYAYFNSSSAYKGIAVQYAGNAFGEQEPAGFVQQAITLHSLSYASMQIQNLDRYEHNQYNKGFNTFDPYEGPING